MTHEIKQATAAIDKIDDKLDKNIDVNNDRLREAEKQSALQEQSLQTICKKVEALDDDVKKISLVSKVIGGIAGGLAVVAAAIGISK